MDHSINIKIKFLNLNIGQNQLPIDYIKSVSILIDKSLEDYFHVNNIRQELYSS